MIGALARLLLAAALGGPAPAPAGPVTLFRFADPRITEASGIAHGLRSPGVFYVQNDSGDTARFFAVNRRTGRTAATVTVPGARNVDWEDIAVAPDRAGTPSVWLADIGDNDAVRAGVQVYRVAEPRIDPNGRDRSLRAPVAQVWRLRYPGGPTDAEGLAVAPDGTAYVVTKSIGSATVYRLPADPRAGRSQLLHRIGRIEFHPTGTANPFGPAGAMMATGATISADGAVFAVRTYADAWVWQIDGRPIGAALRDPPLVVALPDQPQGEGITVTGDRVVVDSEGTHSASSAVALPHQSVSPGTPTVSPGTSTSAASSAPPAPTSAPSSSGRSGSGDGGTPRLLIILVLVGGGLLVVRTAGRTPRGD